MSNPQFGKIITTTTYYEGGVVKDVQEQEVDKFTDQTNLLRDVIASLAVVTSGKSTKIILEVCIDKQNRYRIRQRYTVT